MRLTATIRCLLAIALFSLAACANQPDIEPSHESPNTEADKTDAEPLDVDIDQALRFASQQGDLPRIQSLIAEGANPLLHQGEQPTVVDIALSSANPATQQWAGQYLIAADGYKAAVSAIKEHDTDTLTKQLSDNNFYWYPSEVPLTTVATTHQCYACLDTLATAGYRFNATAPNGDSALISAAANGNVVGIQQLLTRITPNDIQQQNHQGNNALHAVMLNESLNDNTRVSTIKNLLAGGLSPNAATVDGLTPLAIAVRQRRPKEISLLLAAGANAAAANAEGDTPLQQAIASGQINSIRQLANKATVNTINRRGNSPLQQTVASNLSDSASSQVAAILLQQGAKPNVGTDTDSTPLGLAISHQKPLTAKTLMAAGASTETKNSQGLTPLMQAVTLAKPSLVSALASDTDSLELTNANGKTALQLAASKKTQASDSKRAQISQQLITAGAQLDHKDDHGDTALLLAIANQFIDTTKTLLKAGANTSIANHNGWTPLMYAVRNGQANFVRPLAANKDSLNLTTSNGWTALHLAIDQSANVDHGKDNGIANTLIQQGANVNALTDKKISPLYLTALRNLPKLANTLLAAGAQPDLSAKAGWTPLMAAVHSASSAVVSALIKGHANPNKANQDGWTALHFAASNRSPQQATIARLLLENGAQVDAVNNGGMTPLQLAAMNNQADVAKLLLAHGADRYRKNWLGFDSKELAFFSNSRDVLALLKTQASQ